MSRLTLRKNLKPGLYFFLLSLLLCPQSAQPAAPLQVKLTLKEGKKIPRLSEPVTSGIPLPQGAIFADKSSKLLPLRLIDDKGQAVSAQFTPLAPWPDGSLRWVLVDFQAALDAGGSREYSLEQAGPSLSLPHSSLKVKDEGGKISVDTGAIRFVLSKTNFNLLDQVLIDNSGGVQKELISPGHKGGIVLTDDKNRRYLACLEPPTEVKIEESGPLRAVILVRGKYKSAQGELFYPQAADYTVRIYAYDKKDYIRLFFSLENNGRYGFQHEDNQSDNFLFNSLSLEFPLNLGTAQEIASNGHKQIFKPQDRFLLFQRHALNNPYDESKNFEYFIKQNDQEAEKGRRAEGWLDVKDTTQGITVAVRHFWQNYPKAIEMSNNLLSLYLWPQGGKWPPGAKSGYKMRGGTHKTYEILLRFYNPSSNKLTAPQLAAAFNSPLLALPSPRWVAQTKAMGWIAPAGLKSEDKELNEALMRYEQLQRCKVHQEDAEEQHGEIPPSTVYTEREQRGEGMDWYGWMDFGDLPWGGESGEGAYSSGHYDWPYGMLLHFLRSGDRAFFELGDEMVRHRMDIDQYHSRNGSPWLANFAWNEFGTHERSPEPWEPNPSHTWVKGLVLYHLLTGNPKSKEVALAVGEATRYYWTHDFGDGPMGSAELRIQGWSIENLIELYKLSGQKSYLDLAAMVYRERTANFITHDGYTGDPNEVNIYQLVLVLEPLIELDLYLDDQALKDDILRILEFLTKQAYQGGEYRTTRQTLYKPYYLPYMMNVQTGSKISTAPGYNFMLCNALGYAYWITGREEYLQLSQRLFKDAVFYWQENPVFMRPQKRSAITYAASQFPGSRTKIHGWINRYPQLLLYLLEHPKEDTVAPAAVQDLEVGMSREGKVILDWTAPGDDEKQGQAAGYQIKYAAQTINSELEWLAAKNLPGVPAPQEYAVLQKFAVPGLKPGSTYFFAIRSLDEARNQSPISNVVSISF